MAGTGLTHDNLIQAFERRFDYLSARAVAAQVLDSAGVAKTDLYDAGALARIGKAIETIVAHPERILTVLPQHNGAQAGVTADHGKHAEAKKAAEAPAVEPKHAKAEAAQEAKVSAVEPATAEDHEEAGARKGVQAAAAEGAAEEAGEKKGHHEKKADGGHKK